MKEYIKKEFNKFINSEKNSIEIKLKSKNDYKRPFFNLYCKFIFLIQQKIVPSKIKNGILRTTGMNVGKDACIPHDIEFDPFFPELIRLGKGCLIGGESKIITHRVKEGRLELGKVNIGDYSMIAGLVTIHPGSQIAKKSMISVFSEFSGKTKTDEIWGGIPAKLLSKLDEEGHKKFFVKPKGNPDKYYKEFRKKVKDFIKDPNNHYIKIYYSGKRENAGNDWFRARNIFKIWYNGIIVEIARHLPGRKSTSWLRKLLYKLMGVKIGKNVYIGKGVVFDHLFGDLVTIKDSVYLDDYVYFDGHEYTITQTVFGKTIVKENTHLAKHTFVRCGTIVGKGVKTEPYTMLAKVIPDYKLWAGIPAKKVKNLKH